MNDKVACVFGCWTSASRKAVLPVLEKENGMLYYPTFYEGLEQSKNVIYTGQEATQQIIAGLDWIAKEKGAKTFYLIGSDYIWPRTSNNIARKHIENVLKGTVVGEEYYPKGRSVMGCVAFRCTPDIVERIHKVAEEIFLKEYLDIEGAFLSHGQKQWLEIGMLLMQEPELVMLDEPVAGMSPAEREQTAELIKRICKDRCIIVIEHDMEFVSRIADKVTVLHLGKILAEGSMKEVQANPKVIEVYLGH